MVQEDEVVDYPDNITDFGILILNTNDTNEKAKLTRIAFQRWKEGKLAIVNKQQRKEPPNEPQRPKDLKTVSAKSTPKRGVGTLQNRIALIHSIAHMESYAIDLSWDIVCRFSHLDFLPKEFFDDWISVASDEARHFGWLNDRLIELGSYYGDLSGHAGLWQSASATSHDLLARLSILHCVHEARGIDVTPTNIEKLYSAKDDKSAKILSQIYEEEITHVTFGVKWFKYVCRYLLEHEGIASVSDQQILKKYYEYVRTYFKGGLKPPFNEEAREKAGMTKEWYWPLVSIDQNTKSNNKGTE